MRISKSLTPPWILYLYFLSAIATSPSLAQGLSIVPDSSLPSESVVTSVENSPIEISGGSAAGSNLFHSFESFSVETGVTVHFNNQLNIQRIVSRVTGPDPSQIDGLIRSNGSADLFFLNPHGIFFGPNAALDIGGSFIATTASSLNFSDGFSFSTSDPETSPLLTVSVPIGLQFGPDPGAIVNRSVASSLNPDDIIPAGLQVRPEQTIGLIGGDIEIEGGLITATGLGLDTDFNLIPIVGDDLGFAGRIELGSVAEAGIVRLEPLPQGWTFIYDDILQLGDINILDSATLSSVGIGGGEFRAVADNILLADGSQVFMQTFGTDPGGDLIIDAGESLTVSGTSSPELGGFPSAILNQTAGTGRGGDILIETGQVNIVDGAQIFTTTFADGDGGNITINATQGVTVAGEETIFDDPTVSDDEILTQSLISAQSEAVGDAGDIQIVTPQLRIQDGGQVTATTFGDGDGGEILIQAFDLVEVRGTGEEEIPIPSAIASQTDRFIIADQPILSTGDAGRIRIETDRLFILDGATISTTTLGEGSGGRLEIEANAIEVVGTSTSGDLLSTIRATTGLPESEGLFVDLATGEGGEIDIVTRNLSVRDQGQVTAAAFGNGTAGDLNINANRVLVSEDGSISVSAVGEGEAGTIEINANALVLDTQGQIEATTATGADGNILLTIADVQLRNGSAITTNATGSATGGDITIRSDTWVALENSDTTANAELGGAGNIAINTQALFIDGEIFDGSNPSPTDDQGIPIGTSGSDIIANSQFGAQGLVALSDPDVDPTQGLEELPSGLIDVDDLVATACDVGVQQSSFISTGRGGIPPQPGDLQAAYRLWNEDPTLQSGLDLYQAGQFAAAITTWEEILQTSPDLSNPTLELGIQINQAQALRQLGNTLRARALLSPLQDRLTEDLDSGLGALGLQILGDLLRATGDLEEAGSVLNSALDLAQRSGDPQQISAVLIGLGNVAFSEEDTDLAQDYYRQAEAITIDPITQIQTQLNQVRVLVEDQQGVAAQDLSQQIQTQLSTLPIDRDLLLIRLNHLDQRIHISQSLDLPNETLDLIQTGETILDQAIALQNQRIQAYTLGYLGQIYEHTQDYATAQQITQEAILLAQSQGSTDILYPWQWQLGRILTQQGQILQATSVYEQTFDTLQTLRQDLVALSSDVQFSFREGIEPVYREYVSLLLSGNPNPQQLDRARQVIEALQLAELDDFFQSACLENETIPIDTIEQSATAVIYPILLPDRIEVIVSLPQQPLRRYRSPIPIQQVEETLDQFRFNLEKPFTAPEGIELGQQIYDWMIRPLEADLSQHQISTLVFVLDGSLRNVPMPALHDGQGYLVERFGVALTPGLQLLPPQPLQDQRLTALAAGLTEERYGFSALENVALELSQLETTVQSQILLNQNFTSTALQEQIRSLPFPVVHLATHGQFSSDPDETFILAWDRPVTVDELDEVLGIRELDRSEAIELLVLSACQTASGDDRAALGLAGVALKAGARSTVASLWNLDDQSGAVLVNEFYRQLAQGEISRAEALRRAQLTLLQDPDYRSPIHWAPYVLVGNWL